MAAQAMVVWDDIFTKYNFGIDHPMAPLRIDLTARLSRAFGLFDREDVDIVSPPVATDEQLETIHTRDFVIAVREASDRPELADPGFGLGTDDVPAFVGMHEASARIVGGTLAVCEAVWTGTAEHGVNFTGGMHHAMPANASGFCVYNDIAVGIQWLLDNGAKRVAYVDVDVHHGDGVERTFWDDPRVLTISLHETGRALFPGTGWPGDIGGSAAEGDAVNISVPPGTGDSGWLRALHATVPALVRAFKPDIIVSQHGADTHFEDPLAHLAVTVDAQRCAIDTVHKLAHEVCGGRWVSLGGGGYEVIDVVPRTWTHLTAIAAHAPIRAKTPLPPEWLDYVRGICGREGPALMSDLSPEDGPLWWRSWDMGHDPSNEIDRAVMATRQAVFPLHGLDVYFD